MFSESVQENGSSWGDALISKCENFLPVSHIKTKFSKGYYIEELKNHIHNKSIDDCLIRVIKKFSDAQIQGISIKREILKLDNEQSGEDPTLFVRLNREGTKILGEELVYSIYKAYFPEAKKLVDEIGASFIAPSTVILLASRLVSSELEGKFSDLKPAKLVSEFRKRISDDMFRNKLIEFIGNSENSPAKLLFNKAFYLLRSHGNLDVPPILVKSIIKSSPDLFLLLLAWLKKNDRVFSNSEEARIIASITSLSWFCKNKKEYVSRIWDHIDKDFIWTKEYLEIPFFGMRDQIMYSLISPNDLRNFLHSQVVEKNLAWNVLPTRLSKEITEKYKPFISKELKTENEIENAISTIWNSFVHGIFWNKSILLFSQRKYINDNFSDFNQMSNIEDTNSPWDWDHIYPSSWVDNKWYIDGNTKHWSRSIGNIRALSLEDNRRENNNYSPKDRLSDPDIRINSFVKDNDWEFWKLIDTRINHDRPEMVKNHLRATIDRFCNIYEEWYQTLDVGELF